MQVLPHWAKLLDAFVQTTNDGSVPIPAEKKLINYMVTICKPAGYSLNEELTVSMDLTMNAATVKSKATIRPS